MIIWGRIWPVPLSLVMLDQSNLPPEWSSCTIWESHQQRKPFQLPEKLYDSDAIPNLVARPKIWKWQGDLFGQGSPAHTLWSNGLLRYILCTCPKSIVMNLSTCTHGAHKIHSGKTAKDLYLTTCAHGAHKIHSCKNKGVHTAKPFRVYRRGPWPRVQMRPLTACTDEAVTLATLARTIRVYLRPWPRTIRVYLRPWPRTIRVYLRPQKARAQPTPWPTCFGNRTVVNCFSFRPGSGQYMPNTSKYTNHLSSQISTGWMHLEIKAALHCLSSFPWRLFHTAVSWSFLSVFLHCPSPLMIPSSPDTKPWPLHLRWCCRSNAGPSEWSSVEGPGPRPGTRQTIWEPRMKHTVPQSCENLPVVLLIFEFRFHAGRQKKSGLTIYTTLTRNFLWQSLPRFLMILNMPGRTNY